MTQLLNRKALAAAFTCLVLGSASSARAQIIVFPRDDAGFLQGTAAVIRAQGDLKIQLEQSKVVKEQARSLQIENRRRLFDELRYERMNTPSFTELEEQAQALRLRRAQTTAPPTEVWSARALNDLLADLKKLRGIDIHGPEIELDPAILRRINIAGGSRAGNLGVLRQGGKLTWPLGLHELQPAAESARLRTRIGIKAHQAVREATRGRVSVAVLRELRDNARELRQLLLDNVKELEANDYMEAKRYLNNLDDAIKVLTRPDVGNYFNQTYVAKGRTVGELVDHMTRQGLTFAPAVSGDEAAYEALYQALVGYNVSARARAAELRSEGRSS